MRWLRQTMAWAGWWWAMLGSSFAEEASRRQSQPTFGLDHLEALQPEIGGYPLWQYAASLIWVALAFLIATVADFVMTHQLRKLAAKTKTDLDDKFLAFARMPVRIVIVVALLNSGIHSFAWPEWVEKLLSTLLVLVVAGTIVYAAMRLVDLLFLYIEARVNPGQAGLAKLLLPVLGRTLKVFLAIIGVLTTAQYLGVPITSVLAGLGVGGVAVALAAQNTFANFLGTITILADRPFRVGDRVQVDKYEGTVETIGLRSTRIRTAEGHLVTIPNKLMADSPIKTIS